MYIKIKNGIPEYYSINQLRLDNKTVSFPPNPSEEVLAEFDVYPLSSKAKPIVSYTKKVVEGTPQQLLDGSWVQVWDVTDASEEEISNNIEIIKNEIQKLRQKAYQEEADPLYFQWKRGESDEATYLNKIEEIKTKYPYPDGI